MEYKDATTLWELYIDTKTAILSSDCSEEMESASMQEVGNRILDFASALCVEGLTTFS